MPEMPPAEPTEFEARTPLLRHTYPWPVLLLLATFAVVWFSSLKPAWRYVTASVNLAKGETLLSQKNYTGAIDRFKQVLAEAPSSKTGRMDLAISYFANGDPSDDELGFKALAGLRLDNSQWSRIEKVLPDGYQLHFHKDKK